MDKLLITGGKKLQGTVRASGSKNAALPILFSSILTKEKISYSRVPRLKDIETTLSLLQGLGAQTTQVDNRVTIAIPALSSAEAPYDLVRTMRASILVLGPLLAREKKAKVSLPGGCAIGARPVDIHLEGLRLMGANFKLEQGYVIGECGAGLVGAEIPFRFPSVGATENVMMAATLAKGRTVIRNAAREPEIVNLAEALRAMGAKISGEGSDTIIVDGVTELHGADVSIMFDRIEAGTLLLAGPITGGSTRVEDVDSKCLESFLEKLREAGLLVKSGATWMEASFTGSERPIKIQTEPYPGYPTDLQAQLMAFLAQVPGVSEVQETIFENRYMHVPELNRMGADICIEGARAEVHGSKGIYSGAIVMATDLRASASLVLAALAAKGESHVRRIYHLDRGYEGIEKKLQSLGATVSREKE